MIWFALHFMVSVELATPKRGNGQELSSGTTHELSQSDELSYMPIIRYFG